jgi:C4-dicarboxylate transporter, DctM subunit
VLGGAFAGWYTVTGAAGIGAAAALLILLLGPRPAEGRRRSLVYAFTDSAQLTSNVFFIVVGGAVVTYFLVLSGAPSTFADWVTTLPIPPTALLVVILLAMVPVGMFLDALTISLVFVPLVFPIVEATGANPIWFCILAVKVIELGLITPPVGMNAFALSASVPDVPAETVYLGVIPFIVADVAVVALLFAFPDIILFLPEMLGA